MPYDTIFSPLQLRSLKLKNRILRSNVTEIRHATECRVGRSDVGLDRERKLVGTVDDDANRPRHAGFRPVAVAVERAVVAVRTRLNPAAAVAAHAGARRKVELHASIGRAVDARGESLRARQTGDRRDKGRGECEVVSGHGFFPSRMS